MINLGLFKVTVFSFINLNDSFRLSRIFIIWYNSLVYPFFCTARVKTFKIKLKVSNLYLCTLKEIYTEMLASNLGKLTSAHELNLLQFTLNSCKLSLLRTVCPPPTHKKGDGLRKRWWSEASVYLLFNFPNFLMRETDIFAG